MKPLSFIVVGSGWRSLFFVRIAKRFPELFELKYMLCRTQEKAEKMAAEYGIATTTSEEVCEQAKPDFVVNAVNRVNLFDVTKTWSDKGFPVFMETPAADSKEQLKAVWEMLQRGAKIQVAEQYHRYPFLAAGLKAIEEEKIADPYAVHLSMVHDYHGASMIRRMLEPHHPMELKLQYLSGCSYSFRVTETDSRAGAITDGRVKESGRTVVTLQFENNKVAFYDFCGTQYHSFIRSRHLNVQGRDGEWNDTLLRYVGEDHLPVTEEVKAYLNPKYHMFENEELHRLKNEWKPYLDLKNTAQDEYAIATMMLDMREYIEGGAEVYPMREALEDAYWTLLIRKAVQNRGEKIVPEKMPWHQT